MDWAPLLAAARAVREHSHSPYSRFPVGAALLADDGTIWVGTNVENRSYGLTICAERAAVLAAVAAGRRRFRAVLILADADPPASPCGACREVLAEFCAPDLPVRSVNLAGEVRDFRFGELFPEPFVFAPA